LPEVSSLQSKMFVIQAQDERSEKKTGFVSNLQLSVFLFNPKSS
jgi:hypothetical protein